MSRAGPWTWDEIKDDIVIGDGSAWYGSRKPEPIGPGWAPRGLVFVVHEDDGRRHSMIPVGSPAGLERVAVRQAALVGAVAGRYVVVYDGDTGEPVLRLRAGQA